MFNNGGEKFNECMFIRVLLMYFSFNRNFSAQKMSFYSYIHSSIYSFIHLPIYHQRKIARVIENFSFEKVISSVNDSLSLVLKDFPK